MIECSHFVIVISSHSIWLWFLIIAVSCSAARLDKAWKRLLVFLSWVAQWGRGGVLVTAYRCGTAIFPHDMVLQSVSTCYGPIIRLHRCWKDLLWYFPNQRDCVRRATAYEADSQSVIHVITVRWIYRFPRGHSARVEPLSHSMGHPGNIWICHRLNSGQNKESSALLWAGVWSKASSLNFVCTPPPLA